MPTSAPPRYMQGIQVPAESVQPELFFARTRRKTIQEKQTSFAGLGNTDSIEFRKSDILGKVLIRFTGSLVITLNGGTVATTRRWPYDMIRAVRFTANGQSNLINCSGLKLKAREYMAATDRSDRGVVQTIAGTSVNQGTLSTASESWGVGSGTSALAAGTYPVELYWLLPVADDDVDLAGAIFAATSTTDLTLGIDWEQEGNLFATTGAPTVSLTGTLTVVSTKYSIPEGPNGEIVVPDLSLFHSFIQTRVATGVGNGDNELRLIGQGAGKNLERVLFQLWNGATPQVPLAMNATNFGNQGWRFGSNETPELFTDGQHLREINEAMYNVDTGGVWGFGVHDFVVENAFRDIVDEGAAGELRLLINIANGVSLISPGVEYVQETMFAAGVGA